MGVMTYPSVRRGERSRVPGSRFGGSAGGCTSSRGRVRSLASVSVSSDPETGDKGHFWDWTSVSMPGESWTRSSVSEDGRGRVAGDTEGGIKPDTTFANDRGLVGGVVDISSLFANNRGLVGGWWTSPPYGWVLVPWWMEERVPLPWVHCHLMT